MVAAALALAAFGCQGGAGDGDEADAGSGETSAPEPTPTPTFAEAVALELWLRTDHDEVLEFAVEGLLASTEAELDGRRLLLVGSAVDAPVLRLADEEAIQLALAGALLPGDHELVLINRDGSEELRSQSLMLHVIPGEPGPLQWSAEAQLATGIAATARLVSHGRGDDAVLALVDEDEARVWLGAPDPGWTGGGQALALPGLRAGPLLEQQVVLGTMVFDGQRWLSAIWREGDAARRVLMQRWPAAEDGSVGAAVGEPQALWDLDDPEFVARLGPHEARRIDGVALLGRTAFAALTVRRDADAIAPSDRMLTSRWLGPFVPESLLLRGSGGNDLALLHELLDPRLASVELDGPTPRLGLLFGGVFPISLGVGQNGLPQVHEDEVGAAPLVATGPWIRSLACGGLAAGGGCHHFALVGETSLRVLVGEPEGESWSALVELPAGPSAEPAAAVIAGAPTLLLPHGGDLSLSLLRSTGASPILDSVTGLACDDVEVWHRDQRPDPEDLSDLDVVPVACLSGGQLERGALGGS
ncbi:MAG: hypothetical protein KC457_15810 [Myxococcales bacterium]|nr:hypothetical protein [Myxococcales bacterium]